MRQDEPQAVAAPVPRLGIEVKSSMPQDVLRRPEGSPGSREKRGSDHGKTFYKKVFGSLGQQERRAPPSPGHDSHRRRGDRGGSQEAAQRARATGDQPEKHSVLRVPGTAAPDRRRTWEKRRQGAGIAGGVCSADAVPRSGAGRPVCGTSSPERSSWFEKPTGVVEAIPEKDGRLPVHGHPARRLGSPACETAKADFGLQIEGSAAGTETSGRQDGKARCGWPPRIWNDWPRPLPESVPGVVQRHYNIAPSRPPTMDGRSPDLAGACWTRESEPARQWPSFSFLVRSTLRPIAVNLRWQGTASQPVTRRLSEAAFRFFSRVLFEAARYRLVTPEKPEDSRRIS